MSVRILLLCAAERGLRVLEKLATLVPADGLIVCSFREEKVEPPFLDGIRGRALALGARFYETRDVGRLPDPVLEEADLLIAVSWRYLVPPKVFTRLRLGAYVIHDSLLPAYRGFAPTVWALINREKEVGATLFAMTEGVDAGDIVDQRRIPLGDDDRIAEVMQRMTAAYLELLEANLKGLLSGTPPRTPQNHAGATYTCRRLPEDNLIRWEAPTEETYALIRAVSRPYPGAFTWLEDRRMVAWDARRVDAGRYVGRVPGRVVEVVPAVGAIVLTGDGALLLTESQLDGDEPRNASEILTRSGMTLRPRAAPGVA
jgi:methionyl-tRNA formyltransferase